MKKTAQIFLVAMLACGLFLLVLAACSDGVVRLDSPDTATQTTPSLTLIHILTDLPTVSVMPRPPTPTASPTVLPSPTATQPPLEVKIVVDVLAEGSPFPNYLLGSNLPAWLKRETFENEQFRIRVAALGISLLRIPGGSWGDEYGWLSCETGEEVSGAFPCRYPWAARPTDFINFFRGVEALGASIEPMYIVNVNYTAQEAATLVAFFNAQVDNTTVIGLDRNGVNWKTAGDWAALRAANGNPEPLSIHYWEIGNEIYGGKPGGSGCQNHNGWEETWTCKADEYLLGTEGHDGMLALRDAMRAVDPSILVGVVGGSESVLGNRWVETVLSMGGDQIDYLVIHTYPNYHYYGNFVKEFNKILKLPQTHWDELKRSADSAFASYTKGLTFPIVINEYSIIPDEDRADYHNYMNKHIAALFFQPKYYAFPLWSRFATPCCRSHPLPVRRLS